VGDPPCCSAFPDGATGKSFYQKRIPAGAPDWLQSTTVSTPNGTTSNALVVADIAHVVWAVNIGCLGLHLWPYRADDPAHADELRIDLDPTTGIGFEEVRAVACVPRRARGARPAPAIPRRPATTGPPRVPPARAALGLGAGARRRGGPGPRARAPLPRPGHGQLVEGGARQRVFVDFNQNAPHKTVFGAWFARPRVGGQVSTPLTWDEVETVDPET
jgi:DNA primase